MVHHRVCSAGLHDRKWVETDTPSSDGILVHKKHERSVMIQFDSKRGPRSRRVTTKRGGGSENAINPVGSEASASAFTVVVSPTVVVEAASKHGTTVRWRALLPYATISRQRYPGLLEGFQTSCRQLDSPGRTRTPPSTSGLCLFMEINCEDRDIIIEVTITTRSTITHHPYKG